MPDIFISYSRKDSEQALQLAERLQGEGMSVWIDQRGIEAAKSWSAEIVDAIEGCKAFVILLSSNSMQSENVARELSIAYENKCRLLPVVIEDVPLAREFKYPLAGVQRVALNQFDSIRQALVSIGISVTSKPKARDERKSLMLLPFEDLSPTGDNGWFTDGIASEMISALSKIRSLRMIDWNTSRMFRDRRVKTIDLSRELEVRYFIEGQVRKFAEQIKVAVTLFDVETGEYLWQDSLKGTMDDVFDIQENVTTRVIEGLRLHLEKSELASVRERGTTNAEAYALLLQANGAAKRLTLQSYQTSDTLLREAIALDPDYANAYMLRSHVLCNLFKYERNDQHLNEALRCAQKALTLKPDFPKAKSALATVHQLLGDHVTAESLLIEATADDPDDYYSYYALGQLYSKLQRLESSIDAYTRSVELKPDFLGAHWGRVISSINLGDNARAEQLALEALPRYERALRITPSREGPKMSYAALLEIANKPQKSRAVMEELLTDPQLDPQTLYTATCLYSRLGETEKALDTLARSIERGFYDFALLQRDTDLDPLRGEERFHQLLQQLEQKQHA